MANKQHAQFSDENGNLFYLESETEDVLDPSGKPLSNGGDLSEASVKFTADTTRKLPQSGGRFKAFLGSIVKYLSDLGAAAYLAVANNDTTTQAGFVGDARVLKQHRDAINQLSSELYQLISTTSEMTLINAIGYVCDNCIPFEGSGRGIFFCTEGWYDYDLTKSSSGNCSGFLSGHTQSVAYQVYRLRGADTVLKKLGNAIVDLGIISASSQSAATTRDSTFNLTGYSGYKNIDVSNIIFMPISWSNNGGTGKDMDNFQGPAIKSYNASAGIVTLMGASGTGYGWGASIASARFIIIT